MAKQEIKISYWTYPEGDEFEDINIFTQEVSEEYNAEIKSQPTDTMGGGLYELALEFFNDINLQDFVKDYLKDFIEDGIKVGVGFFWKPLFQKIKSIFAKNEKYKPDIESVRIVFRDTTIIIYPLYENSIGEVIDEVIKQLSINFSIIKEKVDSPITAIHIPIFNKVDTYELCAFRVKLYVDENIPKFVREDYFKLWGIKCKSENDFVFDLERKDVSKIKFYTQWEYDKLFDEWFEKRNR